MKSILIFRHIAVEGPGYFGTLLENHNVAYKVVAVDSGDAIPQNVNEYAGLVFMGGPMSVNDDLPWIDQELMLIQQAVEQDIPVLGHCLGGQLISRALGGTITANPVTEIGWHRVNTVRNDATSRWTEKLPSSFTAFHWHGETFSLPDGAERLLSNEYCTNQAFVIGNTLAMQCHVEITSNMVRQWAELYKEEIASPTASVQSASAIVKDADRYCIQMQSPATSLYNCWLDNITSQ